VAFVDHVLTGCSATVAAKRAGFSARSARQIATRLTSKASIQAAVEARQAPGQPAAADLGRQQALEGLLEAVAQARAQGEPAVTGSAWREIGRMLGFYAPERREVAVSAGVVLLEDVAHVED
jgi:phage terminase small subunit